jgi:predicted metal-dependent peptidase
MSDPTAPLPKLAKLTSEQKTAIEVARVGFMHACPFFCYYFYSEMQEYPTTDIPSAATDGRRIFYHPEYLTSLTPSERVFLLAHEVYHTISKHPKRMKHYSSSNKLRDLPWDKDIFNVCADYVINADLVENSIGSINPEWLFDPNIKGAELVEDVYEKLFKDLPPQNKIRSGSGKSFGRPDKVAAGQGGRFDEVLPPRIDPVTGREDAPGDAEFQEAVARAAAAAKAIGNLPGSFKRLVDEILEPQVDWRNHIRMLIAGKLGRSRETWNTPDRRRLVLNHRNPITGRSAIMYLPGRRGHSANMVACAIDTSGSIGGKELALFIAEIGGVLSDIRPKQVLVIWCDAVVHSVDEVTSLDELIEIKPVGGGGTDFRPPFAYIEENNIKPDALIYLTDMLGPFPDDKPVYPVIWCSTSKGRKAPFGDVVEIGV